MIAFSPGPRPCRSASAQIATNCNESSGAEGPDGLLAQHWEELQASAIAADVAVLNVTSFGPGTDRHWETERAELLAHARLKIQTEKLAGNGYAQAQPGYLSEALLNLDKRYRHLAAGGWRSLSAQLEGLARFDQWKPDEPRERADKPLHWIKYEAPPSFPDGGGLLLPNVPERCWRLICERQGLPFPDATTVAGGFWPWALETPGLQLLIVEGWKKALAAVSAGWAAVALPGVTMGRRVGPDGSDRLIAALQALSCAGRRWAICFDRDLKAETRAKVVSAAQKLANCLLGTGAKPAIAYLPKQAGGKTGLDDYLAANGKDALDAVLGKAKPWERITQWVAGHFRQSDIPRTEDAGLVALVGGMGSNKTGSIGEMAAAGVPVVAITHRRSLADQMGARLGIPVLREGQMFGGDELGLRRGCVVVLDSSHPGGSCAISPSFCKGKLLFIDEADAVLVHALTAGTEIKKHRVPVLQNLVACIREAGQVVIASAHLNSDTITAYEEMRGHRAIVVRSRLKPAAGRKLTLMGKATGLIVILQEFCKKKEPFIFHTGSKDPSSKWGPALLHDLVATFWPDASVLIMDSDTIRDPEHPASKAIRDPSMLLAYDVVIATPVLETGFSIEDPGQHFKAVLVYSSGHLPATAVVQSLGRLRSPAERFVHVARAGRKLANGATDADEVREDRDQHAKQVLDLFVAGCGLPSLEIDAFYRWWQELVSVRNREAGIYQKKVLDLAEAEGYGVCVDDETSSKDLAELRNDTLEVIGENDAKKIAALPLVDPVELRELEDRQMLTSAERDRRDRGRITADLGIDTPTKEQVMLWRKRPQRALLRGLLLHNRKARRLYQEQQNRLLRPSVASFKPDLVDHFRDLTIALELGDLMKAQPGAKTLLTAEPGSEIGMQVAASVQLAAQQQRRRWRELYGFDPGNRQAQKGQAGYVSPLVFARQLMGLIGRTLKTSKKRTGSRGNQKAVYVIADPLAPLDRAQVEAHLLEKMESPKPPANTGIRSGFFPIEEKNQRGNPLPNSQGELPPSPAARLGSGGHSVELGDAVELRHPSGGWEPGWRVAVLSSTSCGARARIEAGDQFRVVPLERIRRASRAPLESARRCPQLTVSGGP